MKAHLRVARPTNDLDALVRFYRDGLGFEVIGRFEGHDGFDGVMMGHAKQGWHLEFTRQRDVVAPSAPTAEHLLVFYLPRRSDWQAVADRLVAIGARRVAPHNPFWSARGATFQDPDGYRIVLQNDAWQVAQA